MPHNLEGCGQETNGRDSSYPHSPPPGIPGAILPGFRGRCITLFQHNGNKSEYTNHSVSTVHYSAVLNPVHDGRGKPFALQKDRQPENTSVVCNRLLPVTFGEMCPGGERKRRIVSRQFSRPLFPPIGKAFLSGGKPQAPGARCRNDGHSGKTSTCPAASARPFPAVRGDNRVSRRVSLLFSRWSISRSMMSFLMWPSVWMRTAASPAMINRVQSAPGNGIRHVTTKPSRIAHRVKGSAP